jgi:serine/threonine protein kinase/tetratricopeptide (TPR) repeat protein
VAADGARGIIAVSQGVSFGAQDWLVLGRLLDSALTLPASAREPWIESLGSENESFKPVLRELLSRPDLTEAGRLLGTLPKLTGQLWTLSELSPGDRIGPYRLERQLGAGGMASVWLAERSDGILKRKVALKLPHLAAASAGLAERMARERDILAALEHPHIARLYDAGISQDGRPYIALEYVPGEAIDQYCVGRALPPREILALVLQVARAVAYAHAHLIVHRDLKPSNIQVDSQGQIHLLDFGIAKLLEPQVDEGRAEAEASLTRQLGEALTPDYASPEQIGGGAISTGSDVYSLGIVLYELLAGERPYRLRGTSALALAQSMESVHVPRASAIAKSPAARKLLRGDLDTVLLKCLKRDPAERYATVAQVADDIEHYLRGEPVSARPDSTWYRARKFIGRHTLGVATVTAIVIALAAGLALVSWQARRIAVERDIAQSAANREEAIRYYLTSMFRASVAEHGSEPVTAKTMLDRSAQRVLAQYRGDPYLAGKVVETLSDLYGALEDVQGQAPLLEGFLAQAGPEADPEAVATVRQQLAEVEMARGNSQRASELLSQADAFWRRAPGQYAEQRLQGMNVRGRLQRSQGDLAGSLATYQAAIPQRIALSGLGNRETANLYNSIGITLTALNRWDDALKAYHQSLDIQKMLGRSDEIDALTMLANTGTLALRFGRIAEATNLLRTAFERARSAAGDSAAVAASMGNYGLALNEYGRYAEAVPVLKEATAIAERYAGVASPVAMQDRVFLAEALWGAGQKDAARAALNQNLALENERHDLTSTAALRDRVYRARFALDEHHAAQAQTELAELITQYRKLGPPGQIGLAQALVAEGDALLAQSNAAPSVALLTEAVQLRGKVLWAQSWELAVAQERLGEALTTTGDARGRALLQRAAATLDAQLGTNHPETLRASRALGT